MSIDNSFIPSSTFDFGASNNCWLPNLNHNFESVIVGNPDSRTCEFKGNSLYIRLDRYAQLNVSDMIMFKPDSIWMKGAEHVFNYSAVNFTKLLPPVNAVIPKLINYQMINVTENN